MKKFTVILLLLTLVVCNMLAQTKTTKTNLNFRSAASTKSEILAVIPQGVAVEILVNCSNGWSLVSYKGQLGYVNQAYLWDRNVSSHPESSYRIYASAKSWNSPTVIREQSHPAGATARCVDGTYSYSQHRQGTCSHHGGVAQWL